MNSGAKADSASAGWTRLGVHCALLWLLGPLPSAADSVYLANGEKYEDVVAEVGESQVQVHLPFGTLSLASSQVIRVEKAETPLEQYLHRRETLKGDFGVSPEEWLDLSRWARRAGLPYASRDAALAASDIDPELDGVAVILRSFGYRRDRSTGKWQPRPRQRHGERAAAVDSLELDELRASLERRRRQEEAERCCAANPVQVEVRVVTAPQPAYTWPAFHHPWPGGVVMATGGWDRLKTRVPGSPLPIGKP